MNWAPFEQFDHVHHEQDIGIVCSASVPWSAGGRMRRRGRGSFAGSRPIEPRGTPMAFKLMKQHLIAQIELIGTYRRRK